MAARFVQRSMSSGPSEREIVDHLAEQLDAYPREVVVNYYTALKTMHFVILLGPREADKECLAQGLARTLVGQSSLQWSPIRAHAWWTTQTASPRQMAEAHARFNSLKLQDFIDAASISETLGLPFSFFAGIQRMSPAEVVCYFEDLPRGLFWRPDGSTVPIHLPANLFITGTLNVSEREMLPLSPGVHRHAMTIRLDADHAPPPSRQHGRWCPKLDWQHAFIASAARRSDRARAKLARILPDGCAPLTHVDDMVRLLGITDLPSSVSDNAWHYLANAFDRHGHGLFVKPALENLSVAQDYVMAQSVIPSMGSRWAGNPRTGEMISEYLAHRLPRAYSRWSTSLLAP